MFEPTNLERPKPIRFETAKDFESLPGYLFEMSCNWEELSHIVGKYEWDEVRALRCGLNGCRTKHWHGWVIAAKDGRKTHCGKDCGEREFDVRFKEVEAEFRRAESEAALAANIADALSQRDDLLARALNLEFRVEGCASAVAAVLAEVRKEPALYKELVGTTRTGGQIRRVVRVDREILQAMGQRGSAERFETIGLIVGGDAIELHEKALALLRASAVWPLRQLTPESLVGLSGKAVVAKSAEMTAAREALRQAERFIESAEQFTSARNKREIGKLDEIVPPKSKNQRLTRIAQRLRSAA